MATTITCPRCTHSNTIEAAKAGKPVHCRICHHLLKPAAVKEANIPVLELAPAPPPPQTVKSGPPRPSSAPPAPAPAKKTRRFDEDDDRPRRRERRDSGSGGGSSLGLWLLGGAGALLLLGCCISAGVGYLFIGSRAADQQAVAFEAIAEAPPPNFNPPNFNPPNFNPPPAQVRLNANNPADLDKALAMVKQVGEDFNEACRWFRGANVDIPRRAEVARALEARVDEQKRQPFGQDFFEAYFRWATADNLPMLVQLATEGDLRSTPRRHQAIAALGRLKDARAAEPLVQRLSEFHDRGQVRRALEQLGVLAQPALIKHVNDANRDVRQTARDLLKRQNAGPDLLVPQILSDMGAGDEDVRNAALELLNKTPVSDKLRPEVAKALDRLINPDSLKGPLLKALEMWGTADNAVTIANNLNPSNPFAFGDQVRLLVRFKDPRTVPALTSHFSEGGLARHEVINALKKFGKVAEPEVVKLLMAPNMQVRYDVCRLLGEIGTLKVSGPALQRACRANPMDRLLQVLATNAFKQIQARGG